MVQLGETGCDPPVQTLPRCTNNPGIKGQCTNRKWQMEDTGLGGWIGTFGTAGKKLGCDTAVYILPRCTMCVDQPSTTSVPIVTVRYNGYLHLVQLGESRDVTHLSRPFLTVPIKTTQPSTTSVPIVTVHCNGHLRRTCYHIGLRIPNVIVARSSTNCL